MEEIAERYDYEHHFLMNRSIQLSPKEIWVKHYSSNHQILLVGDGDFSFALSLAVSFRSGCNIVASSINSYDHLIQNYKSAKTNLDRLGMLGARLLFGVDAQTMEVHPDLYLRKFDRIVYNFPHAGFRGKEDDYRVIMFHKNLVFGFYKNASQLLRPNGEVHVSHKTTFPFNCWNIVELASQSCLALFQCVKFNPKDYPGYNNKRGDGLRPDEPFPLGECCTFKFKLSSTANNLTALYNRSRYQELDEVPLQRTHTSLFMDPARAFENTECFRIFVEYFDHEQSTNGKPDCYLSSSVKDHLRFGFQRYMAEDHGRRLIGFVNLLEELRSLSQRKIKFLENRLLEIDLRGGL